MAIMTLTIVAALLAVLSGLATASECGVASHGTHVGIMLDDAAIGGIRQTTKDNLDIVAALREDDAAEPLENTVIDDTQARPQVVAKMMSGIFLFQDFFLFGLAFAIFCVWKCFTNLQERTEPTQQKKATALDDPSGPVEESRGTKPNLAPIDVDALVQAMYSDNIDDLRKLLGERSVNARDAVGCCTALHVAAHCSCLPAAEALLGRGADVNVQDAWDETPLHFAARAGHVDLCALLVQHGADVNAGNAEDRTPLLAAAEAGKVAACEWLLDHGAHTGGAAEEDVPLVLTNVLHKRIIQAVMSPGNAM